MNIERSADGQPASLTYEPFYGLREKPFSLSSDPRFLYTGPSHVPAFDQLLAGIRRREGLIVLSGEIGTGKTTLCRGVLGALDRRTFTTFVRDPFLSREDLLKTLLIDFGVMSIEDLKSGRLTGATRPDLSYPLYEFLDSLVPLQAFAVLIIDEAQNLSLSLLEEIRILSELESREKLLQVVLVGQPELRSNLKLPQLRQVDQRVSVRCELSPLPVEEVPLYIAHRLGVASVGAPVVSFTSEASRLVWRASAGVPRVINLICDRAMHRGFGARADSIDAALVFQAIQDLGRTADVEPFTVPVPAIAASTPPPPDAPPPAAVAAPLEPHVVAPPAPAPRPEPPSREDAEISRPSLPAEPAHVAEPSAGVPHYAQGNFADPLSEFSHEADLVTSGGRSWRAVVVSGIAVAVLAGGAAAWYGQTHRPIETPVLASVIPPPLPASRPAVVPAVTDVAAPAAAATPSSTSGATATAQAEVSDDAEAAYTIQVASFQSRTRARRLLEELAAAGFVGEEIDVDLGDRGVWRQVMVGRYRSEEDAEADLALIRERPSYADARIVAVSGE